MMVRISVRRIRLFCALLLLWLVIIYCKRVLTGITTGDVETELQKREEPLNDRSRFDSIQYIMENRISDIQYFQNQPKPFNLSRLIDSKKEAASKTQHDPEEKCRDAICANHLTKADFPHYRYCIGKTWKTRLKRGTLFSREPAQSQCKFMDGSNRQPIALASYPGSGNTWVRGLLQGVTGLCTGGVYCDVSLRKNGYPGESLRSSVVLVVKIHEVDLRWTGVKYNDSAPLTYFKKVGDVPVFSSAVFVMRNPLDAMVAEYNRMLLVGRGEKEDNHVDTVDRDSFGANEQWSSFVELEAGKWQRTVLSWLTENRDHPVLVVKYEQLLTHTASELQRVMEFLEVPYSQARLEKVVQEGYDKYRRLHKDKEEFDHYTPAQREYVKSVIERTCDTLAKHNAVDISEYI